MWRFDTICAILGPTLEIEGRRAGGTLSAEAARRVWEALPAVGASLVEHGPGLIDRGLGLLALTQQEGFGAWRMFADVFVRP